MELVDIGATSEALVEEEALQDRLDLLTRNKVDLHGLTIVVASARALARVSGHARATLFLVS